MSKRLIGYAIAIGFTVWAVNSCNQNMPEQSTNLNNQADQNNDTRTFSKGEIVPHKQWVYRVDQVSFKQTIGDNQFTKQKAKGKFVIIQGTVKNKTNRTDAIPGSFKVKDQQGRTYTGLGTGFQVASEYNAEPVNTPLPADTQMNTLMVFDVAEDVKQPILVWDTGWGSKNIQIKPYN